MLKKFIICLLFVLIFVQPQVQAIKADNGKLVRVGISDNSFVNYYISSAKISATDEFKIVDKKTGAEIGVFPADKIVTAEMKDNFFVISEDDMKTINSMPYFGGSGLHPDKVDF